MGLPIEGHPAFPKINVNDVNGDVPEFLVLWEFPTFLGCPHVPDVLSNV
jgi:hypothetical protein